MIETKIPGIDPEKIEFSIDQELSKNSFEELPRKRPLTRSHKDSLKDEWEISHPRGGVLLGLSHYTKQLRSSSYRKAALKYLVTSSKYRRTFILLFVRACINRLRSLIKKFEQ